MQKEDAKNEEQNNSDGQKLERNFIDFMKGRRQFHKLEIIRKLRSGELDFEGAAALLHELCTYNEENQTYFYSGPEEEHPIRQMLPLKIASTLFESTSIAYQMNKCLELGISFSNWPIESEG